MAWELQTHMTQYIRPSILAYARLGNAEDADPHDDLVVMFVDAMSSRFPPDEEFDRLRTEAMGLSNDELIDRLAERAEETGLTSNGAHTFYVDPEGWVEIPWCDEDEMLAYNG